jgi:streptogramin lyase
VQKYGQKPIRLLISTYSPKEKKMNTRNLLVSVLILVSVLLAACAPVATPIAPTTIPPTAAPTTVPPTQIPTAKSSTAKVVAEWKINNPSGVYIGFDSVWIPGHHDRTTTRIDPATNKVIAVIQGTGDHAEQALAVGDVFWVTGQRDDTTWIDPKTNTVTTTVPRVKGQLHFIAYGFNSLWLTTGDNKLIRVDPTTGKTIASIQYADGFPDCNGFVFASANAVWIDQCDKENLIKIDPVTNTVVSTTPYAKLIDAVDMQAKIPAGKGTDFIWVMAWDGGTKGGLLRIDPTTGVGVAFLPLNQDQSGDGFIAVSDESIWFGGNGQINRVNVATNQIDATYRTDPGTIIHVGLGFGSVWLENYELNLVQRLDVAP